MAEKSEVKKEVVMVEEVKKVYPTFRYKLHEEHKNHVDPHKRYHAKIVKNEEEDKKLGEGWVATPADLGIETHPSTFPDEAIAAKAKGAKAALAEASKKAKSE